VSAPTTLQFRREGGQRNSYTFSQLPPRTNDLRAVITNFNGVSEHNDYQYTCHRRNADCQLNSTFTGSSALFT